MHSLAGNHPLVDGNKRLAWLGTYVLLAKHGVELARTTTTPMNS
ncbi:MAG: Fic family protein [Solirubrobacteraceae bacterium]